ncbi:PREDICTED: cytokinin dehydrogenase 3-like [Nelumbo nucifera]|uniref:cytokinin dehydrogenase n=2 Tax=Nelumbo nucifera TaxID=4432 RepID=A0A822Y786_NELNU|nr:PREDICTED: cytokinin dehydrogenase 3-like [Nelumbo nucifera]DAD27189.1 TPA_asm: hypothetical protein HUJ06_028657 [Nelumbo nucifera]
MGKKSNPFPSFFILIFVTSGLLSRTASLFPSDLQSLYIDTRLRLDAKAKTSASIDYGNITQVIPAAVLYPESQDDIAALITFSFESPVPFLIAAKGMGHSVNGQAMAPDGVVVNMRSLNNEENGSRINVSRSTTSMAINWYVDAGGEQLWIDVLRATLEYGLAPRSWTDFLYLTVGGTLSNAGISGQTFRYGPQISNVYELDVVTGKGELVTCSKHTNSKLFYAVLGGLGQFGIITRARIALEKAPSTVKWMSLYYVDFFAFTRDQEILISTHTSHENKTFDYIEGTLVMQHDTSDDPRITSLAKQYGIVYTIEVAKYYDDLTINQDTVDEELKLLLEGLSFIPGMITTTDVSYLDFLNRVRSKALKVQSQEQGDVLHPWLNLFIPKSRIFDFNSGVFKGILLKQNKTALNRFYPMNRNKWEGRMSSVIPDEDIFYHLALLRSSGIHDLEFFQRQNREILEFCDKAGIEIKQYLPHHESKAEWIKHFGPKWNTFKARKAMFDPKAILSPGQRIFNSL